MSVTARAILLGVSLLGCALASANDALPRPAGLEPEIAFWRRIFAEVSSQQGLIHDNRHLGVVYEKLDLSAGSNPARIRNASEAARGKYERILRSLAAGSREGLTSEQRRVLELWGKRASNRELRAAAERVRFQQGLADRFHAGLIRSGLWRDHILAAMRSAGVPEELVALPHVESSFDPNARSFVGAAGLWQFTSGTGRRYLRIDQAVDERRDPYQSSEAAARLLQYNYSVLGSWPLAITAYNHGTAGMRRAAEAMGTKDIELIIRRYDGRAFGFASRNFYVSFLAALEIDQDPAKFFGTVRRSAPQEELVVELPDYMRIDTLEKTLGVSRSTLQASNPALLPPVWEGAKYVPRGFRLRLPAEAVIAAPEQVLAAVPPRERFAAQVPDLTYRVRKGDTLSHIARRHGTTVAKLARVNNLGNGSRIRVGQTLKLPVRAGSARLARTEPRATPSDSTRLAAGSAPAPTYRVRSGDSLAAIARRTGVSQRNLIELNDLRDANMLRSGQTLRLAPAAGTTPEPVVANARSDAATTPPATYRVRRGDSLALIARRTGISQRDLIEFNGLRDANMLRSGQTLRLVPPPAATEAAPAPATTVADGPNDATAVKPAAGESPPSTSLADPSDYLVAGDDTIEVQAAETLSHYADWLGVSASAVRKANGWSRQRSLVLGQRVRLVFTAVSRETFQSRRIGFHRDLQEAFFSRYRITDTTEHRLRRGESVWVLASQKYKVPVWLLRQYNPTLNLDELRPGTPVVFPRLAPVV